MKITGYTRSSAEIDAVVNGGSELLRSRLSSLDRDERQMLREALDELEPV
jgi:hypothetical protein